MEDVIVIDSLKEAVKALPRNLRYDQGLGGGKLYRLAGVLL